MSVMVTYTVKEDRVEENEALVRAVYEELASIGDAGIHYATFRKDDGRTFVHVAFFDGPESREALGKTAAFQAFQSGIEERCEVPPNPEPLHRIGSWNLGLPGTS